MAIKPRFTQADVRSELIKRTNRINNAIINRLQYLGELCLTEARTNKTYTDVTGNLTSSMGYVVVAFGRIVYTNGFGGDGNALKGGPTGQILAQSLAAQHSKGFALIMVAGMEYAAAVETRGKIVLATAEALAEKQIGGLLKKVISNISKMN